MTERTKAITIAVIFLACYWVPFSSPVIRGAGLEAVLLVQEYAREHVLFCLVPAFFIAGAIGVFLSQAAVLKYFGAGARKVIAYGVASVSGSVLAVCSCTVLPLFAGIYKHGAGLGPATTFLYSGPAINVLAIILTARVLGWELGLARAVGAIAFSVVIGLAMAALFRSEERAKEAAVAAVWEAEQKERPLWKTGLYFLSLLLILIFAAWGRPRESVGLWDAVYRVHWYLAGAALFALVLMLVRWFGREEIGEWVEATWGFSKQILPLLFMGVLIAGFLMGRPQSSEGIIPSSIIGRLVGGNSLFANLLASVVGAFMYFATLTEIPILQGLIGSGMGQGPALALLLAGPALSLPNMLVIRSVLGTKKTITFVGLVVAMATLSGLIFGALMGAPAAGHMAATP